MELEGGVRLTVSVGILAYLRTVIGVAVIRTDIERLSHVAYNIRDAEAYFP